MRRFLLWLAVLHAAAGTAAAQSVPEVRDVYSKNRPSSELGPAVTPQMVLDQGNAALGRARLVSYEAHVAGAGDVSGTVLLGKSGSGSFDRFRATVRGRAADGAQVLQTLGTDGGRCFVVDLLGKTFAEGGSWEELGAAGALAEGLLWPALAQAAAAPESAGTVLFPSPETVAGELCYVVHFADDAAGAHVYVSLSLHDGLPRRVERVVAGSDG
ncbi:MAG: hypothetical protein ACRDGR_04355, partial [bacterium]